MEGSQSKAGVGVVVRDGGGQVIAALCKKLDNPLRPLEAEAKATEIGVTFAREIGVMDATFEGDSLVVCNAIHGLTEANPTVNIPTHVLAQQAVNVEDYLVWLEECPGCIEQACMHA
ncbi:hypothetical protein CFP56_033778 [Quercus suber]|uniref:RNase H type-1 domain-containing protein n=1 Tax=Quercus suber TaxID=58331 RepID=A0AAW0LQY9_QUESU